MSALKEILALGDAPLALDTETTGLDVYKQDRAFLVAFASPTQEWAIYLDDLDAEGAEDLLKILDTKRLWAMHNAKFDMAALEAAGLIVPRGTIYCTMAQARVADNSLMSLSLDSVSKKFLNEEKSKEVEEWIAENGAYELRTLPSGEREKVPCFQKVPREILTRYAKRDVRLTYALMLELSAIIKQETKRFLDGTPGPHDVSLQEAAVTVACYEMEKTGIRVDMTYCWDALSHYKNVMKETKETYERMAGAPFIDSGKAHAAVFTRLGLPFGRTEKGNPSFTSEVLQAHPSELGAVVLAHREAEKLHTTYFQNFIDMADHRARIHCNLRQGGTQTGRMSCSDPNLQNVPKDDSGAFPVRRAFIPGPGYELLMIDYEQMEYRLMLDYAAQMDVIEEIRGGLDVHQATANIMGVSRTHAKTINFMLLYGGGAAKLAAALNVPVSTAKDMIQLYFSRLPKVREFSRNVIQLSEYRGWVRNWAGRLLWCHDRNYSYKMPNHLIQGGCADIVKKAMVKISNEKIQGATMLLQVHDELIFQVPTGTREIIPRIMELMTTAYPHKHLPMAVSASISEKSWHDKKPYAG